MRGSYQIWQKHCKSSRATKEKKIHLYGDFCFKYPGEQHPQGVASIYKMQQVKVVLNAQLVAEHSEKMAKYSE